MATKSNAVAKTGNVVAFPNKSVFTDADLAGMQSFDDVLSAFQSQGVVPEDFNDYGTGFGLLKDKGALVNVPFMILEWRFNDGDFGEFVSAMVVTKHNEKWVLNDGSTGIRDQLKMVTAQRVTNGHPHPQAGLLVSNGLTRSDYIADIPNAKGEIVPTPATTYYLGS